MSILSYPSLIYQTASVLVDKFYRIFNGNNMLFCFSVDLVKYCCQSSRFTRTCYTCHQNQSSLDLSKRFDHRRQIQIIQRQYIYRNNTQYSTQSIHLVEEVNTKSIFTSQYIRKVQAFVSHEFFILICCHDLLCQFIHHLSTYSIFTQHF